jgi:SH3-like domain-containing protein
MYYSEVFETFFPKSKESKNSIQAENCYCNIETYVEYKDSLNIYDQPDGEIIRSFRFEDDSIYEGGNGVVLDSAYNGWFRILRLESDQNWNDITGGWIASQNIVIGTNNYSGHPIPLLQNPEDGADSTGAILQESYLHPTNCQGAWVYVKSEESDHSEGWLSPLHQCNNPYTNCN